MDDDKWRKGSCKRSISYFSKTKQVYVNKKMLGVLKGLSNKEKITSRFCLHNSPDDNLQDMIIIAYRQSICRKLHKHVTSNEAMHIIEGKVLALIFDENKRLIDRAILSDKGKFAYRNNFGNYHLYFPLTDYAISRETRDGKNTPRETVEPEWDSIEIIKAHLPKKYLTCHNHFCQNPCSLHRS